MKSLRFHYSFIALVLIIQVISVLLICLMTKPIDVDAQLVLTGIAKKQIVWFTIGWSVYFFFAYFDYNRLKNSSFFLYLFVLALLLGLFLTTKVGVQRWYRMPFGFDMQPSELTKLALLIFLAHFLELKNREMKNLSSTLLAGVLILVPFLLVLKQPDLGTAMIILLEGFALLYIADSHKKCIRYSKRVFIGLFCIVAFIFLDVFSYERLEPVFLKFMKAYQVRRLSPESYHQRASKTAIGFGGLKGKGIESNYAANRYLPAAHTDSIFSAFAEHFGLLGSYVLIGLFFLLVYVGFQMARVAKDRFGLFLGVGIAVHLALHISINLGMMCGLLPITGVPLLLMTYGGSATLSTMALLGILQSIYARRFRF